MVVYSVVYYYDGACVVWGRYLTLADAQTGANAATEGGYSDVWIERG